jgi:hypothetical protein
MSTGLQTRQPERQPRFIANTDAGKVLELLK